MRSDVTARTLSRRLRPSQPFSTASTNRIQWGTLPSGRCSQAGYIPLGCGLLGLQGARGQLRQLHIQKRRDSTIRMRSLLVITQERRRTRSVLSDAFIELRPRCVPRRCCCPVLTFHENPSTGSLARKMRTDRRTDGQGERKVPKP
jgi:hypothetical protein